MEIKEKYTVPAYEAERIVARKCDLCETKAEGYNGNWPYSDWDIDETDIRTEVKYRTGSQYPGGGNTTLYEVDICPQCFKDKLIPWVKSQGGTVRETESDW